MSALTLRSATEHYQRQQRITARTLEGARAVRFDTLDRLVAVVVAGQLAAATDAANAVPEMLVEQGIDPDRFATPTPQTLAGWASMGLPLRGVLDRTRRAEVEPFAFDRLVISTLQDTARQASVTVSAVTPATTTYVRMLNTPSCSRCILLAGKKYRHNMGFRRHPQCDCRHVPTTEEDGDDLAFDPVGYFDSLPEDEQNRIFTKGAAEMIRAADPDDRQYVMGRVVNTRWMPRQTSAQLARARRLPEELVRQADGNRAELLRLMRRNRYVR